jgi:hypothetical protein
MGIEAAAGDLEHRAAGGGGRAVRSAYCRCAEQVTMSIEDQAAGRPATVGPVEVDEGCGSAGVAVSSLAISNTVPAPPACRGWTKICPAWSSGWCRRKSNGSLVGAERD